MVTGGNADDSRPVLVSPGSDMGVAVMVQNCPTFSWTAVPWATAYRVAIFKADGIEGVTCYEDMEAVADPVLRKEIPGYGLSWTPSLDERLRNGSEYVWFVQAVDASSTGIWSMGKKFKIEVAERFVGVSKKMRERLREYGVSEEIITDVFKDVTSGDDVQRSVYQTPGLIGIQGTEGFYNTFYGMGAGTSASDYTYNSFFGYHAGHFMSTGSHNTFIGFAAGKFSSGTHNIFIGEAAGFNNRESHNIFIGDEAGYYNTTGLRNTFIGSKAGFVNTAGYFNTFLGYYAGLVNSTGYENTFLGYYTGYRNTTGRQNTFLGSYAGHDNTTGRRNTFLGSYAGYKNTTGKLNVFLGYTAGYLETGSNRLYIDNSSTSSPLIYGQFDTDIVAINGKLGVGMNPTNLIDVTGGAYCSGTTWVDASSREYKENIKSLDAEEAMDALDGLEPVKFKYKRNRDEEHVGFIAEDVPDLVATKDRKGMSAMDVAAVLTKAVQEQQKTILELRERIAELEKKIQ